MTAKIIKELTATKDTNEVTGKQVLSQGKWNRSRKVPDIYNGQPKDNEEFEMVKGTKQNAEPEQYM